MVLQLLKDVLVDYSFGGKAVVSKIRTLPTESRPLLAHKQHSRWHCMWGLSLQLFSSVLECKNGHSSHTRY